MKKTTPTAGRSTPKTPTRRTQGIRKRSRCEAERYEDNALDLEYAAENDGPLDEADEDASRDAYSSTEHENENCRSETGRLNRSAIDAYLSGLHRYTPLSIQEEREVAKTHAASRIALIHHLTACPKTVEEILRITEVNAPAAKVRQIASCKEILAALRTPEATPDSGRRTASTQRVAEGEQRTKLRQRLKDALAHLCVKSAALISAVKALGAPEQTQLDFGCEAAGADSYGARSNNPPAARLLMSSEEYAEFSSTALTLEKVWINARARLVEPNLRFVVFQVKRFASEGMPLADLIGEGNEALLEATDSYDFTRDNKFCSYAGNFITRSIQRAIDDKARLIRIPVHACADLRKINAVTKRLKQEAGAEITPHQIAAETGFSEKKVRELETSALAPKSIHASLNDEDEQTLESILPDPQDWREAAYGPDETRHEMLRTLLRPLLPMMNECQRNVMAAMHGVYGSRPLSEEEAAVALQLSPNQFRAHHAAALSVIERHFRALSTEAA
jgi:RNA polymerase primary sigma factor